MTSSADDLRATHPVVQDILRLCELDDEATSFTSIDFVIAILRFLYGPALIHIPLTIVTFCKVQGSSYLDCIFNLTGYTNREKLNIIGIIFAFYLRSRDIQWIEINLFRNRVTLRSPNLLGENDHLERWYRFPSVPFV